MNDAREKEINGFLNTNFSLGTENIELYNEALIHSSNNSLPNNQRLAFLGDSALGLMIREHFYREYPNWDKENLSKRRGEIESDKNFAKIAIKLELVNYMDIKNPPPNFKTNETLNAEALEALFGAIYLDQGLDTAKEIAKKLKRTSNNPFFTRTT